jgi:hypothetical protein
MESVTERKTQGPSVRLSAETDSEEQCEGLVVTCAHCGRPATECDGSDCDAVLETRDWMVPGYSRDPGRE